jgi:hypothetical protein
MSLIKGRAPKGVKTVYQKIESWRATDIIEVYSYCPLSFAVVTELGKFPVAVTHAHIGSLVGLELFGGTNVGVMSFGHLLTRIAGVACGGSESAERGDSHDDLQHKLRFWKILLGIALMVIGIIGISYGFARAETLSLACSLTLILICGVSFDVGLDLTFRTLGIW